LDIEKTDVAGTGRQSNIKHAPAMRNRPANPVLTEMEFLIRHEGGKDFTPDGASGQNVSGSDGGAERTNRRITNFFDDINATARTFGNLALTVKLDVRRQVVGILNGFTICLVIFQSELVRSGINLAEVVETAVGSRWEMRPDEIRHDSDQENSNQAKRKYPEKNIRLKLRFVF
jgi:hypothetical protein